MSTVTFGDDILDRMVNAVERVRDRLRRVSAALEAGGVPYAIVGGNAVAAWVATVDESAVRNTQGVDILLRRGDLPAAIKALQPHGFAYRHVASIDMFLDGPNARASDAVHIFWAGEKVRPQYLHAAPDIANTTRASEGHRLLSLVELLTMKLTSNRDKDRTHVRDLIGVGLVDATWVAKLPVDLGSRLQEILDDPDG